MHNRCVLNNNTAYYTAFRVWAWVQVAAINRYLLPTPMLQQTICMLLLLSIDGTDIQTPDCYIDTYCILCSQHH